MCMNINNTHKTCTQCHQDKPLTAFYKDKRHADGLHSNCKTCHKANVLKTRDPEAHRVYMAKYMKQYRKR